MSNTLVVINNFEASVNGNTFTGKQGDATAGLNDSQSITISGPGHIIPFSLATASIVTIFDDDDDVPADWDYFHLWCDQDCYVQIIGAAQSVIFKVKAKVPFTLTYDSLLAAASATAIAGGAEPAVVDIDSIVIGNYSGTTASGQAAFFD